QRRLWNSSELYNVLNETKVPITEAIEVLVLLLRESSQKVHINANSFALMKNLRILKIYVEEEFPSKLELKGYDVKYSGSLYILSNELSLFCWHGCPFKYLPSDFYPVTIVVIDLFYSNIKQLWKTPKITTNLEELNLEGCVNLVSVHPSIGMLKRLVVLNLTGCLKVNQLPEALGRIKSLTELHVDRTAITEVPSFVSSLINLESLSFGGQGMIQPRWETLITASFGLLSKQQHPPRSVSLAGLHMLKELKFSYCNLEQVPESIGGLSCLQGLFLKGNNFSSLPGSLSQLSSLKWLNVDGCKKLEVLPELPPGLWIISACDCTSLREVSGSSKDQIGYRGDDYRNCPNLLKNVTIDSEGCISKTPCLDSSITSQGFIHQLSAFLGYVGFETNRHEFFRWPDSSYSYLDIIYHGNSIPEWFTNRSRENHLKCKKPWIYKGSSVNNFDGASIAENYFPDAFMNFLKREVIGTQDSYMIWLHYTRDIERWKEAKKFVTFSFFEENKEDVEVKECGVRIICDEDIHQKTEGTFSSPSPSRSDAITAFASEDASLPDAIGGLLFLKSSIGGLSCPKELHLAWNHFTSLPESLSQLSHLITLVLDDCEVLPELPPSVWNIYACDCTLGSYKDGKTHSGVW
ncbi:NB-ARC domains-containing protein, partial [Tanacetum coccineum]